MYSALLALSRKDIVYKIVQGILKQNMNLIIVSRGDFNNELIMAQKFDILKWKIAIQRNLLPSFGSPPEASALLLSWFSKQIKLILNSENYIMQQLLFDSDKFVMK